MTDDAVDEAAMIAAIEAETVELYLARGRRLAGLSDEALCDTWVAAFCAWIVTQDSATSTAEEDARGEFVLRGLPLPDERVTTQISAMAEKVTR